MRVDQIAADEAHALLGWWRAAGVDTLVADAPFNWLAREAPAAAPTGDASPVVAALPATLDTLRAWLAAGDDLPEARWGTTRIAASGNSASGLMIVIDQPEPGDAAAGQLFAGDVGRLFDRMLAAIGRDRASIYLAPIASIRPPGGVMDEGSRTRLAQIMLHHIALAAPKRLLLMGNAASRALSGMDLRDARGGIRQLNHPLGTVEMVATYPPRLLLDQPAAKAEAWKDLRLFVGGLGE